MNSDGEDAMSHYGIPQWVDFARGVVPEQERRVMRDHLSGGCPECRQVAEFFFRLADVCRNIRMTETPESVVQSAHCIVPSQPGRRSKRASRIPVELVYDSLLAPAPAGMRASWQVGWQALYRAGDCSVDLRIEPELHSGKAAVIGQISNHAAPDLGLENVPVYLKSGKAVVAETLSNRFGEFQLEYEQQARLQLCIYLEGGAKCIHVPLKNVAIDKPVGGNRLNLGASGGRKRKPEQNNK